ncbi:flavin reductase family protein [Rhodococcus sp. ACS1]|uniref:flavin reductase family protein n=1 Tax=Rhodococcus sp. ACS1 TaxID=2028570 RepID=UPI001C52F1B2|nr:flavin reductase family protein [Rhodococcus sp. ACS1]
MTTISEPFVQRTLRTFFGRIPSGVLALGAMVDGEPVGMAVSSFTNVSLDPPLMVVSIRNESATWPLIARAEAIGASILAESQGACGVQLSAKEADRRFDSVGYRVTASGAVVIDDASAWFEATVSEAIPAGDHFLVLLALRRISNGVDRSPLLFFRSTFAAVRHA